MLVGIYMLMVLYLPLVTYAQTEILMIFFILKKKIQFPRCKHLVQMKIIHEGNRQLEIYKVPLYFFFHIPS